MESRPPDDADLHPTIEMSAVRPPRPRPQVEYGTIEPAPAPAPAATVVAERPRYTFGIPLGYTLARFLAFALDVLMVGFVVTSFAYALIAINPITGLPTNTEAGFDTTFFAGLGIALAYVWIAEGVFGTTFWKLAFGLHVYAVRGGMVGLGRSFVRMLLRPIDLLAIGALLSLLPGHRRLGDLLGGTVVARSPLRSFAPLAGWVAIIIIVGLPWVTIGPERALAAFFAFAQFVPHLVVRAWNDAASLITTLAPH